MITEKMLHNANKLVYLAKAYPEKTVGDLLNLFRLAPIDVNCAIWVATELKWTALGSRKEEVDDFNAKGKKVGTKLVELQFLTVVSTPDTWDFGPEEKELEDMIAYAFEKLNAEEKDLEENYLASWLTGYSTQDVLIATKRLLDEGVLHEYELEDGDSAYIFYSLKKNAGKNWGAKQFKSNPLTGEDQSELPDSER